MYSALHHPSDRLQRSVQDRLEPVVLLGSESERRASIQGKIVPKGSDPACIFIQQEQGTQQESRASAATVFKTSLSALPLLTDAMSSQAHTLPRAGPLLGRSRAVGLSGSIVKLALILSTALGNVLAAPLFDASFSIFDPQSVHHQPSEPRTAGALVVDVLSIAALVLGGGLCAGLTLSLMGLDSVNLQVLSTAGSETEKRNSVKVLKLLERGRHWVLVVLLLSNVIVNEALPIFLSDFGGTAAVLVSTMLIVIFGEVLPQSICARYGLSIGAACAPFVWILMIVLAPVAWPTAKLLDWLLGEDHGTTYKKAELKTFVSLHQQLGTENLNEDEVTIIRAVLDLNDKTVRDVMTPIQDVFVMSADTILDDEGVGKLVQSGYSRVPVHEKDKPDSIMGMLLVKDLISYDPDDGKEVATFQLRPLPETAPDLTLLSTLNYFQTGRSHMLLVSNSPGEPKGALGIVTLEDVVEELIGEEIIDETDVWVDVHNRVRVTRNPKETGGGADLGPLVRGIIERRRMGGLKPKAGSAAPLNRAVTANVRAIDRVHFKATDSPSHGNEAGLSRRNSNGVLPAQRSNSYDHSESDAHSPRQPRIAHLVDVEGHTPETESTSTTLVNEPHGAERYLSQKKAGQAPIRRRTTDESQPLLGNGGARR